MPIPTRQILIIAGEPSGDLHGAHLVREMRALDPTLSFFGIGGPLMRAAGVEIIYDNAAMAIIGIAEVIKGLGTIHAAFAAVRKGVAAKHPDAAILIDYPGFNLRLARSLAARRIPVIYYISPQVWIWGRGRIATIRRYIRTMVVFFRFEEELYRRHQVAAEFVGHPLLDSTRPTKTRGATCAHYGLDADKPVVALVPGSRATEVTSLLPAMAGAAATIRRRLPQAQFIVTKHASLPEALYRTALGADAVTIRIAESDMHNVVAAADFAVVASGTATLETAILGTPLIIIYRAHPLTALLFNTFVRAPFIGLANIVAGKEVAPELRQEAVTPERIAAYALAVLTDPVRAAAIRQELAVVKAQLGEPGANTRAARAILAAMPKPATH